jgi:hypothetical protein
MKKIIIIGLMFIVAVSGIHGMEKLKSWIGLNKNLFDPDNKRPIAKSSRDGNPLEDQDLHKAIKYSNPTWCREILDTYKKSVKSEDFKNKVEDIHKKILKSSEPFRAPEWYNPFVLPCIFVCSTVLFACIDSQDQQFNKLIFKCFTGSTVMAFLTGGILAHEIHVNLSSEKRSKRLNDQYVKNTKPLLDLTFEDKRY